jgi:hypothetical protein
MGLPQILDILLKVAPLIFRILEYIESRMDEKDDIIVETCRVKNTTRILDANIKDLHAKVAQRPSPDGDTPSQC